LNEWALIGLGANLGDAPGTLQAAVHALLQLPEHRLNKASSLYRSAPVDATGPDFHNAVISLFTPLSPVDLLRELQSIELAFGRTRPFWHAPRTLDLDLLCWVPAVQLDLPELILPHPRMHERAFVTEPLREIHPELAVQMALPQHPDQVIERLSLQWL
jgi:2-amino-4-hydroxy-6-hydroxymethyldihydropteridine diphosphokinase